MKYSANHQAYYLYAETSTCYKKTVQDGKRRAMATAPEQTNPWIKRICSPAQMRPDKEKMLDLIGEKNAYGNRLKPRYVYRRG